MREADHDDRGANGMGGKGTVSQLHEFDCMPAIFNSGGRLTEGEMHQDGCQIQRTCICARVCI